MFVLMAVLLSEFYVCGAFSPDQNFRGSSSHAVVSEIQQSLREMLEVAHTGGITPLAHRLAGIEASIARSFQALPKNSVGRLAPRPVRYLVHTYFAKEHGWQIKGLEPQGMRTSVSEVHEVSILQDRLPALVESLAETYQSERGLDLADVAAMIAMLERIILDESTALLYSSYFLNGVSASDDIEHSELHEILRSYLLLVEMGLRGNLEDIQLHQKVKERVSAYGTRWPTLVEFEIDAVMSYDYQTKDVVNPIVEQHFSFEDVAHIADDLARRFGKWQQSECSQMKDELMAMDADGSGRVPLSTFYKKSNNQFTESVEYLRQTGAIDDSWQREPKVRVANYITGPSNCIASSKYYSVCCLNECDSVLNELEGGVRAPTASPERILALVGNLTSSSMLAPREVTADLSSKLHGIAEHNAGEVPLHGRLFAQWLHFAFPHECPFPHISEDGSELSAHHWLGGKAIASVEQRTSHIESLEARAVELEDAVNLSVSVQWSEEEVLPLLEPQSRTAVLGVAARVVVQWAMLVVVLRIVLGGCSAAMRMGARDPVKKGVALSELPL